MRRNAHCAAVTCRARSFSCISLRKRRWVSRISPPMGGTALRDVVPGLRLRWGSSMNGGAGDTSAGDVLRALLRTAVDTLLRTLADIAWHIDRQGRNTFYPRLTN